MNAKRTTAAVCALALAVGAAGLPAGELFALETAVTASAADNLTSGKCGENLTWTIDSDGTVTISGTGKMYDYGFLSDDNHSPWYENSSVKKVVIKDGVTHIGSDAFEDCYDLTSITIPNSVTSIGEWAFGFTGITNVTIPDSVTTIGYGAFAYCDYLTSVTIPSSVKEMDDYPFENCKSLKSIKVDPKNSYFTSVDGVLYDKSVSKLIGFPGGKTEVNIPSTVTTIGDNAFFGAKSIKRVDIPDSVTNIEAEAFGFCESLEKVNIPKGVKKIKIGTFEDCRSLTNITIPDGVTTIENSAFSGCTSMTNITIPNSVKTIGNRAFRDCEKLKTVTIPSNVTEIGEEAFGYYYSYDTSITTDTDEYKKVDGFKIKCCSGTAGEKYAKDNGFDYEIIGEGSSVAAKTSITKASFKLSSTSITYTGKAKMPALTVTYGGKKLVKGTDYKVTVSNAKKVGKATATVTGIGNYSGTKKLTYYVVPVKPTISSVKSSAKKKATVKWKKNTTATGYQIQVSLKKNFSTKKSYSVSKNSTVKATISKLTSGKTYYVRMRCYKTIDGTKRYSAYSAVKTVKVK